MSSTPTPTAGSAPDGALPRGVGKKVSTIHQQLVESLRNSILGGEFAPGRRLRQMEIAERFGVSPVPLREALRALEQEGLVASVPRRGWIVTMLTEEEIQEIYELRELLEQKALREAMARLTDEDVAVLEQITHRIVETGSAEQHLEERERFYTTLYGASEKRRLLALILNLHNQLAPYQRLQRVQHSDNAHIELTKALAARDLEMASSIVSRHLQEVSERCIETARAIHNQA